MGDLADKIPAGALWTVTGLLVGGILKGLSVFINKLMERYINKDQHSHEHSKDIAVWIRSRLEAQEAKVQALNTELDTALGKYYEAVKHLEVQAVHLEHCRKNATDLGSEIVALKKEIERLREQPTQL